MLYQSSCDCNEETPWIPPYEKDDNIPDSDTYKKGGLTDEDRKIEENIKKMQETLLKELQEKLKAAGIESALTIDYVGVNDPFFQGQTYGEAFGEMPTTIPRGADLDDYRIDIVMPPNSWFNDPEGRGYSMAHEFGHAADLVDSYIEYHKANTAFEDAGVAHMRGLHGNDWQPTDGYMTQDDYKQWRTGTEEGKRLDDALYDWKIKAGARDKENKAANEISGERKGQGYMDRFGIPYDPNNSRRYIDGWIEEGKPTTPSDPAKPDDPANPDDPNNPKPDPKDPLKCGCSADCQCGCQGFVPGPSIPPWWFDNPNYNRPWQNAINASSPLVLDLNGGGITTTSLDNGVFFDHDGNGFAGKSGWLGEGEGLLVLDINGNSSIDDGGELFGNHTLLANGKYALNGFNALAQYDKNGDGIIDANDAIYHQLKVWVDKNGDGVADEGELLTLAEAGVQSINTGYINSAFVDENGNAHKQQGSFTKLDGTTADISDIWFATDTTDSKDKLVIEISEEVKSLIPDIEGLGNVHSLHTAMNL